MNFESAPSCPATSPTALLMAHRSLARPDLAECSAIESVLMAERALLPGEVLVHQQQESPTCALLTEGMVARYVIGLDGERQMVALHLPGDFLDLHALLLKRLDHEIIAVNHTRVALAPHAPLLKLITAQPALAQKLWTLTLVDAALHRAWLYRVARTDATARVAHFLCESDLRLMAIGASNGLDFPLELTQEDVGEICGITSIHVNRVLKQLRDRGICTFRRQHVEVQDLAALVALGQFEPSYLYYDAGLLERFRALLSRSG